MKRKLICELFKVDDILNLPDVIMSMLFLENRNTFYDELLRLYNNDLSYDWFQAIYEDELAQRNQNKQDFTPNVVGVLLSRLTGVGVGKIYEPTSGNGSLIISNWNHRVTELKDKYDSNEHPVECWELSNRSIPILLLNLSIRGIVGDVYHGDVLTKEIKNKYQLVKVYNSNYSNILKL